MAGEYKENLIIDGHKLHLHPDKVVQWQKTGDCYPIHIEIGVSNNCNQDCVFCALDFTRGKKNIETGAMLRALEDMAKHEVRSVMFGGEGEPTIHRDLGLFVQKAKEYGLDVALTTNGVGFTQKLQEQCLPHLSWVKFSIDAGTPEMYSKIHRVPKKHFSILMENISNSSKLKREKNLPVTLGTQFLMIPQSSNKEELEGVIRELNAAKPDYLSIKPYSDHPKSEKELIVDDNTYKKLERSLWELKSKANFEIIFRKASIERIQEGNKYPECYGAPFISLIDSGGNILPCNLFYGMEEFTYGNINEKSFSEIWEGEKRKEVLDKLRGIGVKNCRSGCRCDAGNRYLHRLKKPQPHDSFS